MSDMYKKCQKTFRRFLSDESGATAIEYVLLVAILAVGLIVGITGIAIIVTDMWNGVGAEVSTT